MVWRSRQVNKGVFFEHTGYSPGRWLLHKEEDTLMAPNKLDISYEKIAGLDLEAVVNSASELNRKNLQTYTTPFPKDYRRLLSHYRFEPRSMEFTCEGEVEGGLSWLVGSLFDLSFTRSLFASNYSKEGGHCFDPASIFFLELAAKLDGYTTYSSFCEDLRQQDKGRRYRELAGIHGSIPGEDDLHNFRDRVSSEPIDSTISIFVNFFNQFGLVDNNVLCTDGQLEPSNSRYMGCAHFCADCLHFPVGTDQKEEMYRQILSGAKRIRITCPFPETVEKVLRATEKKGHPIMPRVALFEVAPLPANKQHHNEHTQKVAQWLDVDDHKLPALRIKWSSLTRDDQGNLVGKCPKAPSDLDAGVGYHIDNQNPSKKELVFGYLQQRTTSVNLNLGLELPIACSTHAANVHEGGVFLSHREKVPIDCQPGQLHILDAGYDQKDVYLGLVANGTIPLIAYNPRRENLFRESLLKRGYDDFGTPYAPCGRLCRSNGYDYGTQSRQYVCGLACVGQERAQCPHGSKALGYSHRMSFHRYPRLIGPIQRGTQKWSDLYSLRTASERTNSYSQEVVDEGKSLKLRGLKAFTFAEAMRTLGHLLRKALSFILNVTCTLGRLHPMRV